MTTKEEFLELKTKSDLLSCVYFYASKYCERCEQLEAPMYKFANNLGIGAVKIYHADCYKLWRNKDLHEEFDAYCNPKKKEELPKILFLEPPFRRYNPYTNKIMNAYDRMFDGQASARSLNEFAKKLLPVYRSVLGSKKDLEDFLKNKKIPNKVILFTNRKETPTMFKVLSATYRDRLDFGEIRHNVKELVDIYNVNKYPTLMVLKLNEGTQEFDQEIYDGEIVWETIRDYIAQFALENKIERESSAYGGSGGEQSTYRKYAVEAKEFKTRNFEKIIEEDKMIIIDVYDDEKKKSQCFELIQQKFGFMLEYYYFYAQNPHFVKFAKETLKVKKFPSIKVLPLGNKKIKTKIVFPGKCNLTDFVSDISEEIEDKTTHMNEKDFQLYMQSSFSEDKIPVILFHNSETLTISWRTFPYLSKYTEKMRFFTFKNPPKGILENFNLKKLPTMAGLFKGDSGVGSVQIAQYSGKMNFNGMFKFFDQLIGQMTTVHKQKLIEMATQEDLENHCIKKSSICFIGFLDARDMHSDKYQKSIEVLEKLVQEFADKPVTFFNLDGICHSYLLSMFNLAVDYMPQLVAYTPSKNLFANQVGTFEFDSLKQFVDKTIAGRVSTMNVKEEPDIFEKDCEKEYEIFEEKKEKARKKNAEDDEILREILEEERLKKEQKEKEQEEENKKKKKKKKKDL